MRILVDSRHCVNDERFLLLCLVPSSVIECLIFEISLLRGLLGQKPNIDRQWYQYSQDRRFAHEGLEMKRSACLTGAVISLTVTMALLSWCFAASTTTSSGQWKITSVKICRSSTGSIFPSVDAIGSYPVYSFFIPRPVWTVNGSVVEAKPSYENGRLVSFQLLGATDKLNPGTKNTIKFALPDQNGAIIFLFDHSQISNGECYEFF